MTNTPTNAQLRQFISDYFNVPELDAFCYDYFPEVGDEFAPEMPKHTRVLKLIDYCERRGLAQNLLVNLQHERLKPYKQTFSAKPDPPLVSQPIKRNPRQVFISHAHQDADLAQRLAADLEAEGYPVWIAPDSILPGEKWVTAISRGLDESGIFVLLLTPEAVNSRWVRSETDVAVEMEHEGEMRLIPLQVKPCSLPALWSAYQRIPWRSGYDAGFSTLMQAFLFQQSRPLHEVKMILVGEGSVGKTSLVRRLMADKFNQGEEQTKGIHIEEWPVQVGNEVPHLVAAHIWDFGGQEIMHATHQFFLTDRSLYLLVLDARQGERESRVEYWLSLIESFAGESPIIIVLNKCDQHYLDLNRRGLLKKYANIAGFVRTSAATGEGLADLKQTIRDTIATMPHVDTPFPLTWFNVKERLEALAKDRNFLLYEAYRDICQKEDVVEDSKQRTLIRFLHDLGIVLNFQDDARVRDTSILNPQWVTQGVYSLINQEMLAQQGGVLNVAQLADLLDGDLYPLERQGFILHMMEKFELAYPFDGGDRYLIPDLLPVEEPGFAWDDSQSLQFAYHYEVLPYSILHRFMVRQHMRICEQVQWRTGVMLHYEGLRALIKADIEDGIISIAINGERRQREFLSNVRFTFDSLHQYITGVKPKEMVPIPGHPEVEPVPYQFLLTLEKNRVEQQFFPGMMEPISVQWLLDGVESPALRHFDLVELREILHTRFDGQELQEILLELSINPNDLADKTGSVAVELVNYMDRRGRMRELVKAVREKRPFLFR